MPFMLPPPEFLDINMWGGETLFKVEILVSRYKRKSMLHGYEHTNTGTTLHDTMTYNKFYKICRK